MAKTALSGRIKKPQINWTKEEFIITLAYYFFIYQTNTRLSDLKEFASDLDKLTHNGREFKSIKNRFGNYDALNPSKKSRGFDNTGKECKKVWNEFTNSDGTPKKTLVDSFIQFIDEYATNKHVYNDFLKKYRRAIDEDDKDSILTSLNIEPTETYGTPDYRPQPKPELVKGSTEKYERNANISKKVISNSKFKCCVDSTHESFETKSGVKYMEAHHLIPMFAQGDFPTSLDVEANIVCLCPNCHRKLHYGKDIDKELKHLYELRKDALIKSGINISLDDLKKYYI